MGFIQFAIHNPVKVAVAVILAVMFGMISLFATPVRLTPEVLEPEITVSTRWPGASAQEVEREIIHVQEEQLKSVEGLREFKSQSSDSRGRIMLKFKVGVDLADARAKVSDKLNQVPEYPENAREPIITTVNPNSGAIAWFILKPRPPSVDQLREVVRQHPELEDRLRPMIDHPENIRVSVLHKIAKKYPMLKMLVDGKNDPVKMRKFAEDQIEARFERVDGIANANVLGGQEQEFRIVVNPTKLAFQRLTIVDLRRALDAENKNISGGDVQEGKNRNVVRTIGQYNTPEQVAQTIIAYRGNAPIRVGDVATVGVDYRKPDGVVRQKGVGALAINAQQAPDTNVLTIMGPPLEDLDLDGDGELTQLELSEAKRIHGDSLRIAAAELNIGVLKQKGLWLEQVYDQTEYIKSATSLVKTNIYVGGALAVLVLLLFLRSWRSVLIVGLTIPISVIATFLFVRAFGRSINVISLAGMAFAVGMVVDNAIVVLENIFRHYQAGEDPETASLKGAQEVWGAVLASTLTTLAVFVPVIFVQGQAGQLFRDIAIAISCAVGLSLIVSITVIPTAACRILRRRVSAEGHSHEWKLFGLVDAGKRFTSAFAGALGSLQRVRFATVWRIVIVGTFVTASIFGAMLLMPDTEYLPDGNRNLVMAMLSPPPGYNIDQMIDIGKRIENDLAPYWETPADAPDAEELGGLRIQSFFFVARGPRLFIGARTNDPLRASELVGILSKAASKVPGVFAFAKQASLFERGLSGGRTIDIEVTGPDLETLIVESRKIFGICLQEFPPSEGNQLRPIPGLELTSPELHVLPIREKAAEMGVKTTDLGYTINALVDGAYAGDYWHEGREIDLVIYGDADYARHTQDLLNLPISTPSGEVVRISSIADVKLTGGPDQIYHLERLRAITIQLTPARDVPLEAAMRIVNEKIRKPVMQTPTFEGGQYQIRLAGTADKLDQTRMALQWNLVLALVITYLLMAALFESFLYPVVIMTSIILALVGGLGGLAVLNLFTHQSLDMLTMLGFVILTGTVVNNAILIVHQALNYMRNEGFDPKTAIVESVRTRIRPIFMSTMTTVLGMLPLVVPVPYLSGGTLQWVSGAGSELYRGLGSVVLGGLIVSTVFTLILIPVGFSLALDAKRAICALLGMTPQVVGEATAADWNSTQPGHPNGDIENGNDENGATPATFDEPVDEPVASEDR